jgi:hypothetical protein
MVAAYNLNHDFERDFDPLGRWLFPKEAFIRLLGALILSLHKSKRENILFRIHFSKPNFLLPVPDGSSLKTFMLHPGTLL